MTKKALKKKKSSSVWSKIRLGLLIALFAGSVTAFGKTIYDRKIVGAYGNDAAALAAIERADPRALSADDLTSFRFDSEAYTEEVANLDWRLSYMFDQGDGHLERPYKAATQSTIGTNNDGLGPIYNATSCESCHQANGRTTPLPGQGYLVRLSVPGVGPDGGPKPHPIYGGQFGDVSIEGVASEGTVRTVYEEIKGTYGDGTPYTLLKPTVELTDLGYGDIGFYTMTSARAPLSLFGLGLLEALEDETLLAWADPNDADGDGISGKVNRVWDIEHHKTSIGRFGWKAEQPSLVAQSADAAANDMGVTTALLPAQTCTDAQPACTGALHGESHGVMELDRISLEEVAAYMQLLAVPARGHLDHPGVIRGEELFSAVGCAACHKPEALTGNSHKYKRLRNKRIQAFTDLLLHDMGEGLSDNRPSFEADGSEWRTPPLWGLGLLEQVNGHTMLLHDGRARNIAEAILWHGGEGEASKEAFRTMPLKDREALITFLKSL
ncbi:MAG: di-heme oxidoredictase family protein [Pseudomonadota bacterium]